MDVGGGAEAVAAQIPAVEKGNPALERERQKIKGASGASQPPSAAPQSSRTPPVGQQRQRVAATPGEAPLLQVDGQPANGQQAEGGTALHDHQVAATASSAEASGGKGAAVSCAKSGDKRGNASDDHQADGELILSQIVPCCSCTDQACMDRSGLLCIKNQYLQECDCHQLFPYTAEL